MTVTREKAEMVAELYEGWSWTPRMIQGMVNLPLYAIEAIVQQLDVDREASDERDYRAQLELFISRAA